MPYTIVIGPPCAGKTTYVREHMQPGDAVIDFDVIAQELGSPVEHDHADEMLSQIEAERQARIANLDPNQHAWIILTYTHQARALGLVGRITVVNTPVDVCLTRARQQGRTERVLDAIRAWTPQGPRTQRKRYRVCPSCHEITEGGRCASCLRKGEQQRRPDGNPYATAGHRRFRAAVLERDPICVLCRLAVARVADHWPVERRDLVAQGLDPNDPDRGRGLCAECHNKHTAATSPGGWNRR